MTSFPLLLFVHRRPEHTLACVASLLACPLAVTTDLHVFCDGPAAAEQEESVEKVRRIIGDIRGFRNVFTHVRDENAGTIGSVVPAVTEILRSSPAVICVEDDVIVAPGFLNFMNLALEHYMFERQVMSVSGSMFRTPAGTRLPESFLYRKGTSFAWATWTRAWSALSLDAAGLLAELRRRDLMSYLDGNGTFRLSDVIARDSQPNYPFALQSWSPRWFASMVLAGGLTLYPRRSLARNTGFDGSGVRSPISSAWDVELASGYPDRFPAQTCELRGTHAIMSECYERVDRSRVGLAKAQD